MYKTKVILFTTLVIFVISTTGWSTTYYVDATNGNDSNTGTSQATPWKTISKVNRSRFQPGDFILFKRGRTWREQLNVPSSGSSGSPITFGAYGTGNKPLILGSVEKNNVSDWTHEGGNIWVTIDTISLDVGNLIFNEGQSCGVKVWNQLDLDSQGKFCYDSVNDKLKIYSSSNPATFYNGRIECAQKISGGLILILNKNYITIENIDLRYCGSHGIQGNGVDHIIIRDCDFSYIGGSEQSGQVRYGNGIEFWNSAHDCIVERCKLWEIYDAALTNQGSSPNQQYNIYYRYNIIWNTEYSFEYWNRPGASITHDIYFENNTCVNAGNGWGHSQRSVPSGRHLCFYTNTAQTGNLYIRNNIFYIATDIVLHIAQQFKGLNNLILDYNCWYQPSGAHINYQGDIYFTREQFSTYQAEKGKDIHSILADPSFKDAENYNFRLLSTSPCIDAGINVGLTQDYEGNAVPQGSRVDIGAFEYKKDTNPPKKPTGFRVK